MVKIGNGYFEYSIVWKLLEVLIVSRVSFLVIESTFKDF